MDIIMEIGEIALYEKIKLDIISKIQSGLYLEHHRIPSENQLTKIYGVSRITVSKALSVLTNEGYIYRIQGKGSFVNSKTKGTSSTVTKNVTLVADTAMHRNIKKIGVIIPKIYDYHGLCIVNAIADTLCYPNYFVTTITSFDSSSEACSLENYTLNLFLTNDFDGIIIFPVDTEIYNETILAMQLSKYPFVLIDRNFPGVNSNYVVSDNFIGAKLATTHLISLGHKKIAFCSSATVTEQITASRFNSFKHTMRKNDLTVTSLNDMTEMFTNPDVMSRLEQCISKREITAAVACNAITAINLYSLCKKHNVRVPEDFSIVCFDNTSIHECDSNFFTYIEQQSYNMGKNAAEIIIKLIDDEDTDVKPMQLVLTPTLVVNKSTAPIKLLY